MEQNQLIETLVFRSNIYNALKDFYHFGPTLDVFSQFHATIESIQEIDHPMFNEAIQEISQFFHSEYELEMLQVEFTTIFIGPGKLKVIPYESGYDGSVKPTLFNEPAINARKRYLDAGLIMEQYLSKPEDHISTELEFMGYMSNTLRIALEEGNEVDADQLFERQKEFFEQHLHIWGDKFSNAFLDNTKNQLFQGIAKLTLAILSFDREIFELEA
ncbi:hypothetical protein BHU72_07150 [Desulfuribacillus stibiiarsenatis]|uniref:Dehydrogenase n=1 Tax=Desulfuribacillus stibiiarsenatis TaxID=1390249 RepID=A0A1E5L4D6_9FIRM|nr:molecular chaperone TorD family protein [Desulfuribacillus stibiiarsenatis]OEH84961.1 hypothetical protein BHU72_07150 [Desulfuribacillus stibiiarsenatis]